MRYIVLPLIGVALVYGQCNMCAPNLANSPFPYGFNPDPLYLPPGMDTSLTIYFTFPDEVQAGALTVYPNYAIWVDSLRLDRGLITDQDGNPFAYNASNPAAGPIHFDQMHRYKQWGSGATDYANFVVYQNPGTSAGPAGQTPPIGCARVCIRTSATEGSDTLRIKVRVFIPVLGDGYNKDTTNLRPILFGSNAWFDTTLRYPVVVHGGRCNRCAPNAANSPFPYGFNPDPLYLPPGIDTSLTIYFTFPDSVQRGALTFYPNYAIWVDSLRLDRGLITTQDGLTFAYNASGPWAGPIIFDQPHRYKRWGSGPTDYANFVVYQNPGTWAGPPGQTPPIGCARVCIRTSATEGSDTLRIKVRVFVTALGDVDNKDTTNLTPVILGGNAWFDTTFRYPVVVRGRCNRCAPNLFNSPFPYGFNPNPLYLPPGIDTSLTIYFTFPDEVQAGALTVYPDYAIWVDSLRLDRGLITDQDGNPFAYNASNPAAGPIHFDQMHRYKPWGSGATDYANFVVYQNPGTSAGPAGQTPPIGCARVCIRTSATEGSDTLRIKVRVFVTALGDVDNKDTTNLTPVILGGNAWFDTTFRYPVVVRGRCNRCAPNLFNSPFPYGFNPNPLYLPPGIDTSLTIYFTFPDEVQAGALTVYPDYAIWVDSLRLDRGLITDQDGNPFAYNASNPAAGPIHFDQMHRYKPWGSGATDYANFVVYQNPGTSAGPAGQTPPIGCARVCIRTSATEGSDTLRIKVRVFVTALGDGDNKDTTNLRPILFGSINAWLDTTFRYAVVISSLPTSLGREMSAMYAFRPVSNPAYREAVVTYTLSQPMAVRLRAYTLDGREVLLRDLGLQPAGTFQETLNLPAGQYFLRLETPYGLSATRLAVIE